MGLPENLRSLLDAMWPSEKGTGIIGVDAMSLSPVVLRAVHQPMTFIRKRASANVADNPEYTDEAGVLHRLLAPAPEGIMIVPIPGPSGAGKSHVIRWIKAELNEREDSDRRHVVLIPKTASLRTVLQTIMEGLEGPSYEEIRNKLDQANESVPTLDARSLRDHLCRLVEEAQPNDILNQRGVTQDELLFAREAVNPLLDEPSLWRDHFFKDEEGAFGQLLARVQIEGEAERKSQFEPSDFDFSALLDEGKIDPLSLAKPARRPFLGMEEPEHRKSAAKVLNCFLDQAIGAVLRHQTGTSLDEVFLDLRKALLLDGEKELVILVEDFAVLSGIQSQLVDQLVVEGSPLGERTYCTVRSAIAYTEGTYLKQTALTRAEFVWELETEPREEAEIKENAVNLVGACFNAARWGREGLERLQAQAGGEPGWLRSFESERLGEEGENSTETALLGAFGYSGRDGVAGHSLFPLNRKCIEQLLDQSRIGGQLTYNPRDIINRVVLPIGRDHRAAWEGNEFPGEKFGDGPTPLALEVQTRLSSEISRDEELTKRVAKILYYWGGNPTTVGEAAQVSEDIYRSFEAVAVDFGAPLPVPDKPVPGKPDTESRREPRPADITSKGRREEPQSDWYATGVGVDLEGWASGRSLGQETSNNLKTHVAAVLQTVVGHGWYCGLFFGRTPGKQKVEIRTSLWLPGTRGESDESGPGRIKLFTRGELENQGNPIHSSLRTAFRAIFRHWDPKSPHKGTWDYEGGEDDAAAYSWFLRKYSPRVLDWLEEKRASEEAVLAKRIAEKLFSTCLLGRPIENGDDILSGLNTLFVKPDEVPTEGAPDPQQKEMLDQAKAKAEASLKDLENMVGSHQGETGKTVIAVDYEALKRPLSEFLASWDASEFDGLRQLTREIGEMQGKAEQFKERYEEAFPTPLGVDEVEAFVKNLREALTKSESLGLGNDEDREALNGGLGSLPEWLGEDLGENLTLATRPKVDGLSLPALGKLSFSKLAQLNQFLLKADSCFTGLEFDIEVRIEEGGDQGVRKAMDALKEAVGKFAPLLDQYDEVGGISDAE